jgi:hypothetical protein
VGETSRQRWNHDQIPEIGSLDHLSLVFLQSQCRVRRRRPPRLGYRSRALTMLGELGETGHFPHYNAARLRSSIGHLTAADFLAGLIE